MPKLVIVVANLIAIAGLLWLFDGPYRAYRLDLLRFVIFQARDNLFTAAADKKLISFDHPAYGMTRQMLNGMIRFAHGLGVWRGIALLMLRSWLGDADESSRFWRNYGHAVKSLPIHARKEVIKAIAEANIAVFSYLCHTSLILFPFVFVVKWIMRLALQVRRYSRLARRAIPISAKRMLDHHAYEIGEQL